MMTRDIIGKILPKTLPFAFGFSVIYSPVFYSYDAFAAQIDHANLTMESATDSPTAPISSIARKAPKPPAKKSTESTKKAVTPEESLLESMPETDSRVKELVYNESNVYVVRAKYGYQTNIVLDPKEEVRTISIGDRSLWQVIPAGNRLFIRPMTANISTNMTLLTNKRSYEFDLKSVAENNDSNVYVLRFTYPDKMNALAIDDIVDAPYQDTVKPAETIPVTQKEVSKGGRADVFSSTKSTTAPEAIKPESIGLLPIRFNYSYTYSGPDAIAPTQVYDDGKSTFIKYKSIGKVAPDAFVIESGGRELRVPAIVQGSSLIIDSIAGEFALRSTDGEIRVYNESLGGR